MPEFFDALARHNFSEAKLQEIRAETQATGCVRSAYPSLIVDAVDSSVDSAWRMTRANHPTLSLADARRYAACLAFDRIRLIDGAPTKHSLSITRNNTFTSINDVKNWIFAALDY